MGNVLHIGTETTLPLVPVADCSDTDIAYIWLNDYQRKMVFASAATNDENIVIHPYYIRPSDNAYPAAGVWVEDIGADQPEVWSADQIKTGALISTNYTTNMGSAYNLDYSYFKLGGSSVDADGSANGVFLGLDWVSGLYKVYIGNSSNNYFKYDGSKISWSSDNASLSTAGVLYATGASISGSVIATSGTIGGWTLATGNLHSTNLYLNSSDEKLTINNQTFGNSGIQLDYNSGSPQAYIGNGSTQYMRYTALQGLSWSGTNASLSTGGQLSVSNILASGGQVAGFTIDTTEGLYAGSGATRVQMKAGTGIWTGATTFASAPFRVNQAGKLYASSATISGNITASSGSIGGWTANSTSLYSTNIGLHSASYASGAEILIGHTTSYADATSGFKVDGSGKVASGNLNWDTSGNIFLDVPDNAGSTAGIIYKNGKRWLYDFNPVDNGIADPDGNNAFFGVECGSLSMGADALSSEHASYNVGIGYRVMTAATGAYRNVGLGFNAMASMATGHSNVGIGYYSMYDNTTGWDNVAIGTWSLTNNTSGDNNIAIGSESLFSCTTGQYNIAIGDGALGALQTADNVIAIGRLALSGITTGHTNIGLGGQAGYYQSDASTPANIPTYSIYIGYLAYNGSDPSGGEDAINNEIVIGTQAYGQGTNTIMLGNVSHSALYCYDTSISSPSDKRIKKNIVDLSPSLSFINKLHPIVYNRVNPHDWDNKIKPPQYKDREIVEKGSGKNKDITKLVKADKRPDDDERNLVGLIAQDVEKLMKDERLDFDLVKTSSNGMKSIAYGNLVMPLIKAVQELTQRIEALESA